MSRKGEDARPGPMVRGAAVLRAGRTQGSGRCCFKGWPNLTFGELLFLGVASKICGKFSRYKGAVCPLAPD